MKDKSLFELQDDLEKLSNLCFEAEKTFIDAEETFKLLDDIKKIKFEQIVARQAGDAINHKEHLARISPEWEEWLKTYAKFRHEKNKAKLMLSKHKRDWDTCRSRISALKQEMNTFNYGGTHEK